MSFYLKLLLGISVFGIMSHFIPSVFAADSGPGPAGIPQLEYLFSRIICISVPIGYTALIVVLVFAGFKYLTSGGEVKAVASAHQTVTWGLLGVLFFVIAWLILQLIQNFTGVEVTKFTLSSLPGVQGFTGSCWAEPPVVPEPTPAPIAPQSTTQRPSVSNLSSNLSSPNATSLTECHHSNDIFRSVDPRNLAAYSTGEPRAFVVYKSDNPDDLIQLENVLTKPTIVLVIPPEADDQLYFLRDNDLARQIAHKVNAKEGIFNDPERDSFQHYSLYPFARISKNLTNARAKFEKAQLILNNIWITLNSHPNSWNGIAGISPTNPDIVSCDDGDFILLITHSPLIYLYPQQQVTARLRLLTPIISSVKTRKGNWNLVASPNGILTALDGKKYKFIPYEFLRNDFKRPTNGFIIEGSKLEEYLKGEFWPKLGISKSEIEDYWNDTKNRVKQSNYYFISLIDKSEIDRVLPMEINPKPDTILRNMTYILPLSSYPTKVPQPLELSAPKRNGFTVLENGVFVDGF